MTAFRKPAPNEDAEDATSSVAIRLDCLVLHPKPLEALLDGVPLDLTRQQFQLLLLLVQESGRLVLKQEATRWLWPDKEQRNERRLTVLVSRLRAGLVATGPYSIETVRKRGYRLLRVDAGEN
ncbi:MAG TPA: helix-turn-helix domain-containing protein [Dehalococcoidia bacterium]|nr:helix-turn-helix domain-containing protein [Dehalococcoidia bacterium]